MVSSKDTEKNERIWVDGCYDMVHFGHANSFRQAKALGMYLIVGVHSDAEIQKHKFTPPVFTEEERYELIRSTEWVDDVVEAAPYVTTLETLNQHNCEFCAHGNDITLAADGTDTYQKVKDAKRYKEVERTQGVSTTDLIRRMIRACKEKHGRDTNNNVDTVDKIPTPNKVSPYTGNSKELILTTQRLRQFGEIKPPALGKKIVYVSGTFDVFNIGHLRFLMKARELGDFLVVGLFDDDTATSLHGPAYPIMTFNERILSLLACKYVSEVVFGAPLVISKDLIDHLNISVVAIGKTGTMNHPISNQDLYEEPKRMEIFQEIDSGCDLTTEDLVARVAKRADEYEERNRKKEEKEVASLEELRRQQQSNLSNETEY